MINKMTLQNASKFAIFLKYKNVHFLSRYLSVKTKKSEPFWNGEIFNKPTFAGSCCHKCKHKGRLIFFKTGYGLKTGGKRAVK